MSFARNFSNKYRKLLLGTGLNVLKTAYKKAVHKATKAAGEFMGNKIADKVVKQKPVIDEKSKNF